MLRGRRRTIRQQLLLVWVGVGLTTTLATTAVFYVRQKNVATRAMDGRLLGMARLARELLPPDFHDRIDGPESVTGDEFAQIVDRNNRASQALGIAYLWSLMEVDGEIVFTSATSPDKVVGNRQHAAFFERHTNPELYTNVFATMRPVCQTSHDKWGALRSALVPGQDERGRKFLFGAGTRLSDVTDRVRAVANRAAGLAFVTFAAVMVAGLWSAHRFTRSLRRLSDIVRRTAAGERNLAADEGGVEEVSVLARHLNRLNRAQQSTIEDLKAEGIELERERQQEQEQAAATLRSSETRYRELVNLAVDGILQGSPEGMIVDANECACSLFGLPRDRIVGKHIREMPFDPESVRANPFRFDLLDQGYTVVTERKIRRADGTSVVVEMRSRRMPDGTLQSIYRDVTERTKAQQLLETWNTELERRVAERTEQVERYSRQLRALAERLANVEEDVRRRIADVLHEDLQQVLVAARMTLGTASEAARNPVVRQSLQRVDDMLGQSLRLSRTLVQEVAVPAAGEGDIATMLGAVVQQTEEKFGLKVRAACDAGLKVQDRHAFTFLHHALRELLFNVVKHAKVRDAEVSVVGTPEGLVELTVRDAGVGGLRGDAVTEHEDRLGLFSLRERAEALGGGIRIASDDGKGTVVSLWVRSVRSDEGTTTG